MKPEDCISTGVLELYALGALADSEAQEVEALVAKHPELRTELLLIQQTLEKYAQLHQVAVPGHLKERILEKIDQQSAVLHANTGQASQNTAGYQLPKQTAYPWWAMAAAFLLLCSIALNLYFYTQWADTRQQLSVALSGREQLAQQYQVVKKEQDQIAQNLAAIRQPGMLQVVLQGTPQSAGSSAVVHWNKQSNEVYLEVAHLPAPPAGHQYQLWALADGKPVDAGVFDLDLQASAPHKMKQIRSAQAFAITLEPAGGLPQPTLANLHLMGKLPA